jgi:hypothetical protein
MVRLIKINSSLLLEGANCFFNVKSLLIDYNSFNYLLSSAVSVSVPSWLSTLITTPVCAFTLTS